jgi:hypothetical protein
VGWVWCQTALLKPGWAHLSLSNNPGLFQLISNDQASKIQNVNILMSKNLQTWQRGRFE